jgi:putative peptidoglycan lipid II flippase
MMVAVMLSRVLGLARDMVISGLFGQGRNTDIYYSAFRLPDLLFYLIAGGVMSAAFVPVFVEYLSKDKRDEAWELFSIIASVVAVFVIAFICFGEIFARQLVPYVAAPGLRGDPAALDQIAFLTRIILPAQFFFFMGGLMMASLWAHQQFIAPGLGPSIYNIGIITGGAIAGSQLGPQGVEGLAWGALVGAFAGNFVLQFAVIRRYGMKFRLNFNYKHPAAVRVWWLMLPVIFSLSLTYIDVWVNSLFASYLFKGAISSIERANRLMQLPIGIFGQSIAIGFYTTLAAQYANDKMDDFRETVNYGLRSVAFVTIPAAVLLVILRVPIIELLFQHGRFSAQATKDVADPLIFYSIGIVAWSVHPLLARSFYSMHTTWTPVITGTLVTALFVPLNWVLMHAMMHTPFRGHSGLALATSIAAFGDMALLLFLLRRRAGGINLRRIFTSMGKTAVVSAFMGVGVWLTLSYVSRWAPTDLPLKVISGMRVFIPTIVGGIIFIIMVRILRLEESATVLDILKRKFGRRREQSAS